MENENETNDRDWMRRLRTQNHSPGRMSVKAQLYSYIQALLVIPNNCRLP
jgi:hypothetical protein